MQRDVTRLRYLLGALMRLVAILCALVLVWKVFLHTLEAHEAAQKRIEEIQISKRRNRALAPNQAGGGLRVPAYLPLVSRYWLDRKNDDWDHPWHTMIPWLAGAAALWAFQRRFPRLVFPMPPANTCPDCAYDLGREPPDHCPECGSPTTPKLPAN